MNEGMFIALRGLGQETNSLLMQILEELKAQNAPDTKLKAQATEASSSTPSENWGTGEPVYPGTASKPAAKKGK